MARTFSVDTRVSLFAALAGDEGSGRFSHELVKGEYRMRGQKVVVTITDKHWLLPWPVVKVRLRELLASA
jgi:hypothetical protein